MLKTNICAKGINLRMVYYFFINFFSGVFHGDHYTAHHGSQQEYAHHFKRRAYPSLPVCNMAVPILLTEASKTSLRTGNFILQMI